MQGIVLACGSGSGHCPPTLGVSKLVDDQFGSPTSADFIPLDCIAEDEEAVAGSVLSERCGG